MIEYKIKKVASGNCPCAYCQKTQPGLKLHPYSVWYKDESENRGHNLPACSVECCKAYIERNTHGR